MATPSIEPRVLRARQRQAAAQRRGVLIHRSAFEVQCRLAVQALRAGDLVAERVALERAQRAAARLDAIPRPPSLGIVSSRRQAQLVLLLKAVTETADDFERAAALHLAEHLQVLRRLQLEVLLELRLCGESLLN